MTKAIRNIIALFDKIGYSGRQDNQKSISGILSKMSLSAVSHDSSIKKSITESCNSASDSTFTVKGFLIHALLLLMDRNIPSDLSPALVDVP